MRDIVSSKYPPFTAEIHTRNHCHAQHREAETLLAFLVRRFVVSVLSVTNDSKGDITGNEDPFRCHAVWEEKTSQKSEHDSHRKYHSEHDSA